MILTGPINLNRFLSHKWISPEEFSTKMQCHFSLLYLTMKLSSFQVYFIALKYVSLSVLA